MIKKNKTIINYRYSIELCFMFIGLILFLCDSFQKLMDHPLHHLN